MAPADFQENGITGWFKSSFTGLYQKNIPGKFLREMIPPEDPNTVNFHRRDDSEQYLRDWTETERKRFGFNEASGPEPENHSSKGIAQIPELGIFRYKEIKNDDLH